MEYKLEEKEEAILHNVLNLSPVTLLNVLLHTYEFPRRPTYMQLSAMAQLRV